MVPRADFVSYYGRPVVKGAPWTADIPAYLFLGGLAGASAILAAGADATGRPALRRSARLGAAGGVSVSFALLVHDLGRPERFLHMLRVAKPSSPMSMGTWLLSGFGALTGTAAAAEVVPHLPSLRRLAPLTAALAGPAGAGAAALGAGVATYTAVLLSDTATPAWHEAQRQLPFAFAGSAATAAAGWAMLTVPPAQARPARRLALAGAIAEVLAERRMDSDMGLSAEALHQGLPGRLMSAGNTLTLAGAATGVLLGGRSRLVACASGLALLAGSAAMRFGVFHGGQASAQDPRYTIVPQRRRVEERERSAAGTS